MTTLPHDDPAARHPHPRLATPFPIRLLGGAVALTVCLLLAMGWSAYDSYRTVVIAEVRDLRLTELQGSIVHLDEVLTMSARMAATTGNPQWEQRYRRFESALEEAVTETARLTMQSASADATRQTQEANRKLLELENRAFALVRAGRAAEAEQLLSSDTYEGLKKIYAAGMAALIQDVKAGLAASQRDMSQQAALSGVVALVATGMLVLTWLKVLGRLRRWRAALGQALAGVRDSEDHFRFLDKLAEATRTLTDPGQIMTVMCRMLGQHLGASRCAYADAKKEGDPFVFLHDYTDGCESLVGRPPPALAVAEGAARLRSGQTVVVRDADTEYPASQTQVMSTALGVKAIIVCPLTREGNLRALMAVHQTTPRNWTPGEVAIIQDVVEKCWATIERGTAQETLRLSEKRSRSIIDSAQDAFVSIDSEGVIREWNHQAEAVFGWPRGEVIGTFLHEKIIPHEHREAHLRGIRHLQATGTGPVLNKPIELTALRRNGEQFPVEMTIWALSMGAETTYNAFLRDLTERKRAQAELEDVQKTVDASRQAGMAEIATNVLHNVGNILNSVNVSATLVSGTLRTSRARGLSQAVQMLDEHAANLGDFLTLDPKGKLLPGYLAGVAQALAQEQQQMSTELAHLTDSIDHIKGVVATQQSYAGGVNLVEPLQICDVAEDALRMNCGALERHGVTVVKQFSQVPVVRLDRVRVLQILVNLISNAGNAMENVPAQHSRITLSVDAIGSRGLRVSVRDEGEGIPVENLTRIFAHGFTTRKKGHGFGLHSCALAARQMGGTLTAHSDGPGRGATFTLELPTAGNGAPQ
ncbi:MAG: multi-sensor signal transduction histidine kinase [Ramlibacter sp.]|nr:multi-sensor signal transduction histidine kinase [Ramlibacter sp.]